MSRSEGILKDTVDSMKESVRGYGTKASSYGQDISGMVGDNFNVDGNDKNINADNFNDPELKSKMD